MITDGAVSNSEDQTLSRRQTYTVSRKDTNTTDNMQQVDFPADKSLQWAKNSQVVCFPQSLSRSHCIAFDWVESSAAATRVCHHSKTRKSLQVVCCSRPSCLRNYLHFYASLHTTLLFANTCYWLQTYRLFPCGIAHFNFLSIVMSGTKHRELCELSLAHSSKHCWCHLFRNTHLTWNPCPNYVLPPIGRTE